MGNDLNRPGLLDRRQLLAGGGAAFLGLLAAPGLLAGCDSSGSSDSDLVGGALVGNANTVQGLDPHTAGAIGSIAVCHYVFEGLYGLRQGDRTQVVPQLATGEPEPVGANTYQVKIRPGATFHDGTPLTAQDVAFSINRVLDPKTASLLAVFFTAFAEARAIDDSTVEITLKGPLGLLTQRLALIKVMSQARTSTASADDLAKRPIGSGPYTLTSFSTDATQVRLSRFAGYQGPLQASLPEIGFDVITEDAARLAALQSGQLAAMTDVAYQDVDRVGGTGRISTGAVPSFNQSIVIFNTGKAPFGDKRVRQAFLYAIDRDTITSTVYFGKARPATSYLPADHAMYHQPTVRYGYDLARAKTLLDEAGTPTPGITLLVSNLGWLSAQVPLLQASLQQAGFVVKIEQGETESLVPRILAGEYDAWLTVTDPSIFGGYDADMLIRWVYTGTLPKTFARWDTPEAKRLGQLLDQALAASDAATQKDAYAQIQEIIADQAPAFTVHHRDLTAAWTDRLSNPDADPAMGIDLLGVRAA